MTARRPTVSRVHGGASAIRDCPCSHCRPWRGGPVKPAGLGYSPHLWSCSALVGGRNRPMSGSRIGPQGTRGARTHNPRIKRVQDYGHCGLYRRLCPHRVPHQPHQQTTVDVISCHEPCHAPLRTGAVRRCWTASPQPASAVSRAWSEFHRVRVGGAKISLPALARAAVTRAVCSTSKTTRTWPATLPPTSTGRCTRRIRVGHLKRGSR
jgi:hypothetical protein